MIFTKQKRRFFIIEILFAFFLLAVFIGATQHIPRLIVAAFKDRLIALHLKKDSDRDWVRLCQTDFYLDLPRKKGASKEISKDIFSIKLFDQFHISGAKSVSARVLELKSAAEGSLTALYCVDIRFAMDAKKLTPVMSTYYFSADLN